MQAREPRGRRSNTPSVPDTRRPVTSAEEPALVVAARHGDREALDRLLRLHQPRLHTLCRRMCQNPSDALDALQDSLIAIVRGLPRFDGRSSFGTWSYRVATNACLDELRRRHRRPVTLSEPELATAAPASATPDEIDDRLDIDRALDDLVAEFRLPVVLRDLCGFGYEEIARVLDIPPGTVRSRIARGRAALARRLAPAGGEPDGAERADDVAGGNPPPPDQRRTSAP